MILDQAYWEKRYQEGTTAWDTGSPTQPLTEYIDQLDNKALEILIPGAGNAYEAEYLFQKGFENVYVIDFARQPLENLKMRTPNFTENQLIQEDLFSHQGMYDLILEQTFFCAIDPSLRQAYVEKIHSLLKPEGKLVGVLWSVPMSENQPPFGGSLEEYEQLFSSYFQINVLAPCYNSIKPRSGREAFINLSKKSQK